MSDIWGIVGSRGFIDFGYMCDTLAHEVGLHGRPHHVVSGGAKGADKLAEEWAALHKIEVRIFPADWERHGRRAGAIRNRQIVEASDRIYAFVDGVMTPGTKITVDIARELGVRCAVYGVRR